MLRLLKTTAKGTATGKLYYGYKPHPGEAGGAERAQAAKTRGIQGKIMSLLRPIKYSFFGGRVKGNLVS